MAELKRVAHTTLALFQSSDLNSLAAGSAAFGSGAALTSNVLDNTSNLYVEGTLQILLGSFNPTALAPVTFFILWSVDGGTTYPDPQSAGAPPVGYPIFTAVPAMGASAKKLVIPGIPLLPLKGKPVILNGTNAAFASSGNSATLVPTGFTVA